MPLDVVVREDLSRLVPGARRRAARALRRARPAASSAVPVLRIAGERGQGRGDRRRDRARVAAAEIAQLRGWRDEFADRSRPRSPRRSRPRGDAAVRGIRLGSRHPPRGRARARLAPRD